MDIKPTVFISHASEDEVVAKAWKELIIAITGRREIPFIAEEIKYGIEPGEKWDEAIDQALDSANIIIAILTPSSNDRPWVLWESGFAYGRRKKFMPVTCYLGIDQVSSVFSRFEIYNSMSKDSVLDLCKSLFFIEGVIPEYMLAAWDAIYDRFRGAVDSQKIVAETRSLFSDHFHNHQRAKAMDGYWLADWYYFDKDGNSQVFEKDELCIWTTDDRIRVVGFNTKIGIGDLGDIAKYYPMEGVVSAKGWIVLSYWSAGTIQFCGTVLLEEADSTGLHFAGTWEGYTAKSLIERASHTKGAVELSKIIDKDVEPLYEFFKNINIRQSADNVAEKLGKDHETTERLLNHLVITGYIKRLKENEIFFFQKNSD